jgi:preprotein translocase subunit SecD
MMKLKLKKIFTNIRVIILLIFIVAAIISINPRPGSDGVIIMNVISNSSASEAGILQPSPNIKPVDRERVLAINNKPIKNEEDYFNIIKEFKSNQSVQLKTSKGLFRLTTKEAFQTIGEGNLTKRISKGVEDIGLRILNAPTTNIRKGLDLQGGTRVLLQPETPLLKQDLETVIGTMEERLNIYGLSDLIIRDSSDLAGNQYILVEIAGANEDEIKNLLASQGKFEAVIANETVFVGGEDISFVCRSADCAGIDPNVGCFQSQGQHVCGFRFSIAITPKAAQKHAETTSKLDVIGEDGSSGDGAYLSEPLELFLDDVKVDQLNIGASLKGSETTQIQISGSGTGSSQQEAVINSLEGMKRLQTVMITGSLPVKLNIVKVDTISPLLGKGFLENAILVGLLALLSVGIVVFARYRKLEVAIPMVIVSISEAIILLGIAALIGWNIDLAAVAGIIIAVGTGVDHQIVIADEALRGRQAVYDWKQRIKNAFFIIMASYFTVVVAMIPLLFAGAGLLKGFAIITILGASIGVFVSRPAFARTVEILLKE